MEFWDWFMHNAGKGWKIVVAQDGVNNNWACNVYDDKGRIVGSFDECDGYQPNSIFPISE